MLGPIILYLLLSLAILFAILALSNSVGNLIEIMQLLDKDKYSGEQIAQHYTILVERWGIWQITMVGGVSVEYVNIKNAMFNGVSITYLILFIVFFVLAFVIGKLMFPLLVKQYENNNEQMVDLATLQTQETIKEIKTKKPGGWF